VTVFSDDAAALLEDTPAMLWRGDVNGRCVYLNRAQREFWGLEAAPDGDFDWSTTLLEEDQAKVFGPFQTGMREQAPFTCEARYRRADGAVRILRTRARPYRDAEGRFAGMIGVNEDLTELRDSLEQARVVTRRLELATQISGIAMSEHDESLRYTWAHNLPEDAMGRLPSDLVGEDIGRPIEEVLRAVMETGNAATEEAVFSVDDQRQWWEIQACRTATADGKPAVLASALDVTTRKLNAEKLEVLARELNHRVKNVYAVVQAVVHQSARSAGAPPQFAEMVSRRLVTLAEAQDALLTSGSDRGDLRALLSQHLAHLERVEMSGDDVSLPARIVPYVALAMHELGTNALKYGALSTPAGRVRVSWREIEPGELEMTWAESGGQARGDDGNPGFGTALLTRIFAGATDGTAERGWTEDGLRWVARFPLTSRLSPG
jgi:PAS domain S-box-containing protein